MAYQRLSKDIKVSEIIKQKEIKSNMETWERATIKNSFKTIS